MDKKQGPIVYHRELYSKLVKNYNGKDYKNNICTSLCYT